MDGTGFLNFTRWSRGFALVGVVAVGLVGIVGSMPSVAPCEDNSCNFPSVTPSHVTALVGTTVTYTAKITLTKDEVSYQWRRSSDGGTTWADIQGATDQTYSLAAVNLADDGAMFDVAVEFGDGSVLMALLAYGHLAVSAHPGIEFEDGEFRPEDWSVTPFGDASSPAPVHTEEQVATGGNPNAYRKMVFQAQQPEGWARVLYTSRAATYDPLLQGAIYVIDYEEDVISLDQRATVTNSAMLLEQGGRTYIADIWDDTVSPGLPSAWRSASRASLAPENFRLISGSPCQAGESCPDFSTSGLPMRFGYSRSVQGAPGDSIAHGIDNWKVTVWSR